LIYPIRRVLIKDLSMRELISFDEVFFFLGPTTAGPTASSLTTETTIDVMYPIDFVSIWLYI